MADSELNPQVSTSNIVASSEWTMTLWMKLLELPGAGYKVWYIGGENGIQLGFRYNNPWIKGYDKWQCVAFMAGFTPTVNTWHR